EHQVGGVRVERDVADLVADQQRNPLETGELLIEPSLTLGVCEQRDPLGCGSEDHALPGQAGADRQRDRQVRLAGAGWPEQDHVFLAVQEVELTEVLDHLPLDRALEGEVELLERLSGGKARSADASIATVSLSRGGLGG